VGVCETSVDFCVDGEQQDCVPLDPPSSNEICNNLDDNCNGEVDEGFGTMPCGVGECLHDYETCVDGVPGSCDPMQGASAEICDDGLDNDCDGDTDLDDSDCICGNNTINLSEQCDGTDLGGQSCETLTYDGGNLGCNVDCTYDFSNCYSCGDGSIDGGEECDGSDFGGQTCSGLGYDGGDLACNTNCTIDVGPCWECGDGEMEGPEACDDGGDSATCDDDCTPAECGDDYINSIAGEQCDGVNLGGATCASLGEGMGTVTCDGSCMYDTSGCMPICYDDDMDGSTTCDGDCDDNNPDQYPDNPEQCDGIDNDCDPSPNFACEDGEGNCSNALGSQIDMCVDGYECVIPGDTGTFECGQLCKNTDDCDAGEACSSPIRPTSNVHTCDDCADQDACIQMCTTDENAAGGCDPGETCTITRIISGGGPFAVRQMYAECTAPFGAGATGAPCESGNDCLYGPFSCINGLCAAPCLIDSDCPNDYHCSTQGIDLTDGTWGAGVTATWTVPVCLPDEFSGSHSGVGGDACTANGDCMSEFCDANLGICIDLCMFDSDCSNGLTCELALMPTQNGWTGAETCLPVNGYGDTLVPM
jgi:hypothetical protein